TPDGRQRPPHVQHRAAPVRHRGARPAAPPRVVPAGRGAGGVGGAGGVAEGEHGRARGARDLEPPGRSDGGPARQPAEQPGALLMALTVVDVDSHVYEPEAIWGDYLPDGVRDRARRAFSRQNGTVVLNGARVTLPRVNRHAAFRPGLTPDDIGHADPAAPPAPNPGAWDAAARLADMDALGVAHAVVLPTLFAEYLPAVDDAELATALARAYNDWAVDLAGAGEGRLHPAAVVALHDPLAAAKEVARAAGRGLRAVAVRPAFQRVEGHAPTAAFGGAGDVNPVGIFVDDPAFAPLWQSIADHGLVACVHPALGLHNAEGTSAGPFLERVAARLGVGHTVTEPVAYMQDIATFVVSVAFHGLLEDYPELKLALLHGG